MLNSSHDTGPTVSINGLFSLATMPSPDKKIIVLVGATGRQGGSVARTFLSATQSSYWRVRCLTRNPSSEAAKYVYQHQPSFLMMSDSAPEILAFTPTFEGLYIFWTCLDADYH